MNPVKHDLLLFFLYWGSMTYFLVNTKICFLIEKYGVVPKKCFPESHTTEASRRMNDILNHKVQHVEQDGTEFGVYTLKLLSSFFNEFLSI